MFKPSERRVLLALLVGSLIVLAAADQSDVDDVDEAAGAAAASAPGDAEEAASRGAGAGEDDKAVEPGNGTSEPGQSPVKRRMPLACHNLLKKINADYNQTYPPKEDDDVDDKEEDKDKFKPNAARRQPHRPPPGPPPPTLPPTPRPTPEPCVYRRSRVPSRERKITRCCHWSAFSKWYEDCADVRSNKIKRKRKKPKWSKKRKTTVQPTIAADIMSEWDLD